MLGFGDGEGREIEKREERLVLIGCFCRVLEKFFFFFFFLVLEKFFSLCVFFF